MIEEKRFSELLLGDTPQNKEEQEWINSWNLTLKKSKESMINLAKPKISLFLL